MKIINAVIAALAFLASASASAQVVDTFGRANASTLGTNWTQRTGTSSVVGNQAMGTNGAIATYNGATANTVNFDIVDNGASLQYIAAILGYSAVDGSGYFIKVQNNTAIGSAFTNLYFYTLSGNGSASNAAGVFTLASSFTQGHVTASYTGSTATLTVTPLNGIAQVYSYTYAKAATGTGVGLGFYGAATVDNFAASMVAAAAVPEPATWGMMILGFGVVGGALRHRRRTALACA